MEKGEMRTDPVTYARIAGNMPANMVAPLLPNIAKLNWILIEFGAQENFSHIVIDAEETAERLTQAGSMSRPRSFDTPCAGSLSFGGLNSIDSKCYECERTQEINRAAFCLGGCRRERPSCKRGVSFPARSTG